MHPIQPAIDEAEETAEFSDQDDNGPTVARNTLFKEDAEEERKR